MPMAFPKDITGQRFGRLIVLKIVGKNKCGNMLWLCRCDCGKEKVINGVLLRLGATKSCGCLSKEMLAAGFVDIAGQKFYRIKVISLHHIDKGSQGAFWNCVCDCGTEKVIRGASLKNGMCKSCGCLGREIGAKRFFKHGLSTIPENRVWIGMKARCGNTKDAKLIRNYVDRGIKVCQRWKDSFEAFYGDMGSRPTKYHTIERIDNDLNYSCGKCYECIENGWKMNCEWHVKAVQNRNRRGNHWLEYQGERLILTDWAWRVFGINPKLLESKLRRGKKFENLAEYYLQEHDI